VKGVTCLRVFADANGETHMQDIDIALQGGIRFFGELLGPTITASRTPPMQSPGDENLGADSIGPMLLGHPHAKSEKICAQLRLLR
jgi:hypothetical protein